MVPELAPRVEDFIKNPTDRDRIELIISVKDKNAVLSKLESYGAEHLRDLPRDCMLISAPDYSVEEISEIPEIERIEENSDFKEFGSGK